MAEALAQSEAIGWFAQPGHYDIVEPRAQLRWLLKDTGEAQLETVKASAEPASEWLRSLWERARKSRREADHNRVAEKALDALSRSDAQIGQADLSFLATAALSEQEEPSFWEALESIRLMASLAEDGMAPRNLVEPALIEALEFPEASRRLAAVEGLWQCDATHSISNLEALVAVERNVDVKRTAEHVINVLRRLAERE